MIRLSSDYERNDRILDPVPPCFLSQLNCIKVYGYRGDEMELSAVKILLECTGLGRISHILFTAFCKGLREAEEGS